MNSIYRILAVAVLIALSTGSLFSQTETDENRRSRWSVQLEIGAGNAGDEACGEVGASVQWEYRQWLDLGLALRGITRLDHGREDALGREYHREAGYTALRLRPNMEVLPGWEIALPLEMGSGLLIYRYESKYAEELRWTEEILDQLTFAVYSAGIESRFSLGEHYALVVRGGYRTTSPVRSDLADTDELSSFWGDAGVSYRF